MNRMVLSENDFILCSVSRVGAGRSDHPLCPFSPTFAKGVFSFLVCNVVDGPSIVLIGEHS